MKRQRMGSTIQLVRWLGNPATHHYRAGGFASHSFERFAFFTTILVIGTNVKNFKLFFRKTKLFSGKRERI